MRTQSFILLGMIIIVVSGLASIQSALSSQSNEVLAYLRILGLVIGFLVVTYGVWRLRAEQANPSESAG